MRRVKARNIGLLLLSLLLLISTCKQYRSLDPKEEALSRFGPLTGTIEDTSQAFLMLDRIRVLNDKIGKEKELKIAQSARDIMSKYLAHDHPRWPDAWNYLGYTFLELSMLDSAAYYIQKAFETEIRLGDTLDVDHLYIWNSMAGLQLNQGNIYEARQSMEDILRLAERIPMVGDSLLWQLRINLAVTNAMTGNASQCLELARNTFDEIYPEHQDQKLVFFQSLIALGQAYYIYGAYDSAAKYTQWSLDVLGEGEVFWEERGAGYTFLNTVLSSTGDFQGAMEAM
ncbi:MAG: hypothetical protein AAF696_09560, partial [Bacteroidota bacterium]